MRPIRVRPLLLALALPLAACASSGQNPSQSTTPRYDRNLISAEEMTEAAGQNIATVYDLVRTRRPQWLRTNVTGLMGRVSAVSVWVDRSRMGGVETLRNVPLSMAVTVRYLSPSEAQGELGLDNTGGAIVVSTRSNR